MDDRDETPGTHPCPRQVTPRRSGRHNPPRAHRWIEAKIRWPRGSGCSEPTWTKERMRAQTTMTNPALMTTIKGVGPVIGARLLITAGDNPDRLRSSASFARFTEPHRSRSPLAAPTDTASLEAATGISRRAGRSAPFSAPSNAPSHARSSKRSPATTPSPTTATSDQPAEPRPSPSQPHNTSGSGHHGSENPNSATAPTTTSPTATSNGSSPLDTH